MRKGFTLIELLVVISIIAILSGIILAALSTARGKASDGEVKEDLVSLRNAAELYYNNNGNKYENPTGVTVNTCPTASTTGNFLVDPTSANGNGWAIVASLNVIFGTTVTVAPAKFDCGIGSTGLAWSVAAILPSGAGSICVDNTGASKSYANAEAEGHAGDPHGTIPGQTSCN